MLKILAKLLCWLRGHRYIPAYRQRTVVERFRRFTQVQYNCECCDNPTRWMRNYQHNIFLRNEIVSWDDHLPWPLSLLKSRQFTQ